MNSFYLASQLLRGKWLLEPLFLESQGAIVANYLNKYTEFQKQEPDLMSAFAIDAKSASGVKYSWYSGFDKAPEGSVAVIRIRGPLMKEDQDCGPIGMESIGEIIKSADAHHNINAIVLHIDSPGGTVDGTEALASIVKGTQKPVVAFIDGMMASAAFWIGSSADERIASTDTDEVGSVGVLASFADVQPYWEKLGVKFHTITASTSPDKVKMWEDVRAGKYEQYRKEVLDVIDEKFMNAVRENLPNIKDEHLTAKLYFARDVMGIMIDSIGTLESAILRASELAQQNTAGSNGSQANSQISNQKSMSKKYLKIQKALGSPDALELEADGGRTFTSEEMDSLENALAANSGEELQGQLDRANLDLQQANQTVADRDQTIADLNQQIATLKAAPAEKPATAAASSDEPGDGKPGPVVKENDDLYAGIEKVSQAYLGKGINE
jgi:ClpP class serine protease